ncbi:hypothetical protein IGI39_003927 [Enterococcus sp. AZ135]|uniref:MurR/RpiR family transcriptional regulator n=1 Tax=unclassified Enterococcus TaxID=2608891 RepID=UPI003F28EC11
MLLHEQLEKDELFSPTEKAVADFVIDQREKVQDLSTKEIAKLTFTSQATAVRLSQKLGFSGWSAFKEAYVQEINYIDSHFSSIDPNIPFNSHESFMTIANKVGSLIKESVDDTLALLDYQILHQCIHLIDKSAITQIFAVSTPLLFAEEFKLKMARIGKSVRINTLQQEQANEAINLTSKDCAILISYTGESDIVVEIAEILKKNRVPMIVISSIGDNTLANYATYKIECTTREKLYSKIDSYTSNESFSFILDILYSGLFSIDYDKNLAIKIENAKRTEKHRYSNSKVIKE